MRCCAVLSLVVGFVALCSIALGEEPKAPPPAAGVPARLPAYRLMVSRKTKKEAQPLTWIFTGSKVMDDGKYAADAVGYLVSVLNNELTVIDISDLASRDLESREWDRNADLLPPVGT